MHPGDQPLAGAEGVDDGPLDAAYPPDTFALERAWVLDSPAQLSPLRTAVLAAIAGDGTAAETLDEVAENMVLIASELATNALKYGLPPTVVSLLQHDGSYLLDVADHDLDTAPFVAGDRPAGHGGLGMHIAQRLAQDVGWYATDTAKHVWAMLPVRPTA